MKFKQICALPHEVYVSQLFALGEDGKIYVESHGVCDNREVSFWTVIDWDISPHAATTAPMTPKEKE